MRIRSIALLLSLLAGLLVVPGLAAAQDATEDMTEDAGATEAMTEEGGATEAMTEDAGATEAMTEDPGATEAMTEDPSATQAPVDTSTACDADALTQAVEGGPEEGTTGGMADDPVGTAASNNPVLSTLTTAVQAAGLLDTLNSAEALTVFAPTDCAFAQLDQATLDAALADPSGLLTTVLGYHVIAGEMLTADQLSGEYETFSGETLTVNPPSVADGQAEIVVPDVMTANATVHLIDNVLLPPSVSGAAQDGASEAPATPAPAPAGTPGADAPADEAGDDSAAAPSGGVATGAGGTAASSTATPLIAVGVLALLALGGVVVARRSA